MERLEYWAERLALFGEVILITCGWLSYRRVAMTPWLFEGFADSALGATPQSPRSSS